jgi:hypothetical protein
VKDGQRRCQEERWRVHLALYGHYLRGNINDVIALIKKALIDTFNNWNGKAANCWKANNEQEAHLWTRPTSAQ